MANNEHINKVVKSTGETLIDLTGDTVTAGTLLKDVTAHDRSGAQITGTVIVAPTDVTETEDNTAYLYKNSEHDAVYDELVGGSVAWNQLVANSGSSLSVTITSGHKYVIKKNGTLSVGASSGSAITGLTGGTDWITDLTLMFGTTIADYVYNLEQSTEGSGIAWLKSYGFFTKDYYAYNAGGMVSVNTSGKRVVGKNLLEAKNVTIGQASWMVNGDGYVTASNQTSDARAWNYNNSQWKLTLPAGNYIIRWQCLTTPINPNRNIRILNSKNEIVLDVGADVFGASGIGRFTLDKTTDIGIEAKIYEAVIRFMLTTSDNDSTYEPYTSITYPIQSTDLRGLYKLNGSELYTDGDIYSADGQITRKYGYRGYQSGDESLANAITDGTHTIYKLSAPTTETASSFSSPQMVYRNGTEEYLDTRDVPIPVGGNRKYVDIPEWMVNEYFDDLRAETSTISDIIKGCMPSSGGNMTGPLEWGDGVGGIEYVPSSYHLIIYNMLADNGKLTISSAGKLVLEGHNEVKLQIFGGNFVMGERLFYMNLPDENSENLQILRMTYGSGSELVIDGSGYVGKSSSSRDIKHDIQYVEDTDSYHDALMRIKPATYVYNNDKTETAKLGMIAEDIADVMPIAAITGEGGKVENYDTRAIIAMLVMEVQRLNAEIERLRGDSNAD